MVKLIRLSNIRLFLKIKFMFMDLLEDKDMNKSIVKLFL